MEKVTNLAREIIKEIPDSRRALGYTVESGSFSDSRKNVCLVGPNEIKKKFRGSVTRGACFNNTLRNQLKDKDITRAYVRIEDCKTASPKLTYKEKKQWIELAQKYNFLPGYIKASWADKGEYVFNLNVKDMSPSLLYAYLSVVRYPRDEPAFTKSILIMADHGVNYYIAFALASKMYISNSGHHIINVCTSYPYIHIKKPEEFLKTNLEVGAAVSLKRYFDNPGKWDKRSVLEGQMWNCQTMIKSTTKINIIVKASKLYDPSIIKAVMQDKDK